MPWEEVKNVGESLDRALKRVIKTTPKGYEGFKTVDFKITEKLKL